MDRLNDIGLSIPEILLPAGNVDMEKWAVIACDQFTSEKEYWKQVANHVGDAPSTLNMILPEAYLEESKGETLVDDINGTMERFLDIGLLEKQPPGFILVDRSTPYVSRRLGLVAAVDLECYSFEKGATTLVRPTEGTVLDRLPPRMAIRRNAPLDLPHILLLIDDPQETVIGPVFENRDKLAKLYDFQLQQNGGQITGWFLDQSQTGSIAAALENLVSDNLLFAVGDGNHSLATARQLWLEKKKSGASPDDPSRYAMVEIENIHDNGLLFHPIHRVLFNIDQDLFITAITKALGGTFTSGQAIAKNPQNGLHTIGMITGQAEGIINFQTEDGRLTVEHIQQFLDDLLRDNPSVSVDYVHDQEPVRQLGSQKGNIGIYLPDVDKTTFFDRIRTIGPFPRKTFSIGHGQEKRYYIESRLLR